MMSFHSLRGHSPSWQGCIMSGGSMVPFLMSGQNILEVTLDHKPQIPSLSDPLLPVRPHVLKVLYNLPHSAIRWGSSIQTQSLWGHFIFKTEHAALVPKAHAHLTTHSIVRPTSKILIGVECQHHSKVRSPEIQGSPSTVNTWKSKDKLHTPSIQWHRLNILITKWRKGGITGDLTKPRQTLTGQMPYSLPPWAPETYGTIVWAPRSLGSFHSSSSVPCGTCDLHLWTHALDAYSKHPTFPAPLISRSLYWNVETLSSQIHTRLHLEFRVGHLTLVYITWPPYLSGTLVQASMIHSLLHPAIPQSQCHMDDTTFSSQLDPRSWVPWQSHSSTGSLEDYWRVTGVEKCHWNCGLMGGGRMQQEWKCLLWEKPRQGLTPRFFLRLFISGLPPLAGAA